MHNWAFRRRRKPLELRVDSKHPLSGLYRSSLVRRIDDVLRCTLERQDPAMVSDELAELIVAILAELPKERIPDPLGLYPDLATLRREHLIEVYNEYLAMSPTPTYIRSDSALEFARAIVETSFRNVTEGHDSGGEV